MKRCTKCKKRKLASSFNANKSAPDGLQVYCRACGKEYYSRDPERNRRYFRKWRYGITEPEYLALLAYHDGKCAVCLGTKKLSIDHDHKTREIRGLLCSDCNIALGLMKDDPVLLKSLAAYVESPPAQRALSNGRIPDVPRTGLKTRKLLEVLAAQPRMSVWDLAVSIYGYPDESAQSCVRAILTKPTNRWEGPQEFKPRVVGACKVSEQVAPRRA